MDLGIQLDRECEDCKFSCQIWNIYWYLDRYMEGKFYMLSQSLYVISEESSRLKMWISWGIIEMALRVMRLDEITEEMSADSKRKKFKEWN
jgi:hypothetical protein